MQYRVWNKRNIYLAMTALLLMSIMATAGWSAETRPVKLNLEKEWKIQFQYLALQIQKGELPHANRPYNTEALIHESDRHPVGVMLRRTQAMLNDLKQMPDFPLDASALQSELDALKADAAKLPDWQRGGVPQIDIKIDNKDLDGPPLPVAGEGVDMGVYAEAFVKACELNRKIALANPLLDFDKITFVLKHPPRVGHMCDQWFGMVQNPHPNGGLYVLENYGTDEAKLVDLIAGSKVENGRLSGQELHKGVFASPEVTYDGETIWFSYSELKEPFADKWEKVYRTHLEDPKNNPKISPWGSGSQPLFNNEEYHRKIDDAFHLMKINADGTGLTIVTDGAEEDHSPCVLPNGRVAFVSTRRGGEGRCHPRACPTYVLYSMLPDGTDIQPLSYHEINEWSPRVNNDGDIVYSRWDYVDRNFSDGQHPWIIKPDGRNSRALYGNYESPFRGRVQADLRAIPDSRLYVATLHSHHSSVYGSFMIYNADEPDDAQQTCLTSLTPDIAMEPSRYASPYPLNEKYFLCVWSPDSPALTLNTWRWEYPPTPHGVYVLDAYGNRTLLFRDSEVSAMAPLPLAPRKKEPVQPHMVANAFPPGVEEGAGALAPDKATAAVMNVYESELPWPEDRELKSLRIVQVFPKTSPRKNNPPISYNVEVNVRGVIGTVPIEEDGSIHFEVPVGKPVYFQVLDENGLAVQSMRSSMYAMPGEKITCVGCHEPKNKINNTTDDMPIALMRAPSKPAPGPQHSYPISFPLLIQPVLDKNCVECHSKEEKAPDLSSKLHSWNWTKGYENLKGFAWCLDGQGRYIGRPKDKAKRTSPVRSIPGEVGATESLLYPMLTTGSHKDKVKLSNEDMAKLTLWLDNFSVFTMAYDDLAGQRQGKEVLPHLE
jgi:hypothetical protein